MIVNECKLCHSHTFTGIKTKVKSTYNLLSSYHAIYNVFLEFLIVATYPALGPQTTIGLQCTHSIQKNEK